MKTDDEIKTDVLKHIKGSALESAVTGVVRKTKRPHNSKKEDVVISMLANENGQVQYATVNVNIYVRDEVVNGQEEEASKRIGFLSKLAADLFDVFHGSDFRAFLSSQRTFETDSEEHVINNKIEYHQVNE